MDEYFDLLKNYNLWGGNTPQMGFIRHRYTDKMLAYVGNRLIKVLSGQRRVGKSYLLRQLAAGIVNGGVDRKNTFFVNREFTDFDFLKTYKDLEALFKLYKERVKPEGKVYLFIDEIQNIEGWEHFVNSYSQDFINEYELFISGSNSNLLSGELATLLSGRYVNFEIFPFSYEEYIVLHGKDRGKQSYLDYLESGGLPELIHLPLPEIRRNYVLALKDTVLLRDIIQRYNIKEARLLEDIFVYIVNNASNLLSIGNITNYFKSRGRKTSYDTVAAYIRFIEQTYLIHRAERYNIRGKEIIAGNSKYYMNDLSFSNYLYRGFAYRVGYKLENLVYLDLLREGYDVYVGSIRDKEVDFVAVKGDRTIYLQSTYLLVDKETIEREYSALEAIGDHYEKIVVSLDDVLLPSKEGIRHLQAWNLTSAIQ